MLLVQDLCLFQAVLFYPGREIARTITVNGAIISSRTVRSLGSNDSAVVTLLPDQKVFEELATRIFRIRKLQ